MASQRNIYAVNDSSIHLPPYPSRPDWNGLDDYKPPAEDDIIDSYTTTAVPLPKQSSFSVNSTYPPSHDRTPPPPLYPPFGRKQSSWEGQSDGHSGGGGAVASDCHLNAPKEIVKTDTRSFFQKASANILPDSMACRFYVLTVLLETIIDITIEADLYLRIKDFSDTSDLSTQRLPVYLGIFCFAHVFQLAMAIDAVHARNTLQFLFLTIFNALFLIYAVIQIFEIRSSVAAINTDTGISSIPVNVLTTIIPIVISVAEIAYIALGWKIWQEFGWKVYKRLGADRQVRRMYAQYQIFVGIMKFDVFFFVGFCVQLIALVLHDHDWEYYVTYAALPFSILVLVDGMLAARYENIYMMLSFMLGCGGALVYFVYKLFRIYQLDGIEEVRKTLTVFAVIAIILLITTVVVAFIVMRNFGGGLKYHMNKNSGRSNSLRRNGTKFGHSHNRSYPLAANPNRMSID
ncbi:hypothetical protein ACEPAI_1068 [Sanghuangporus weigelae]